MQTFALKEQDGSSIPEEHLAIWKRVHRAQLLAMTVAHNGSVTKEVDEMARTYLSVKGYGEYFTHRLGHGELSSLLPKISVVKKNVSEPLNFHLIDSSRDILILFLF